MVRKSHVKLSTHSGGPIKVIEVLMYWEVSLPSYSYFLFRELVEHYESDIGILK